ncbi:hypothetical protein NDU88_002226 [Pleurodeles waltl]|uniref:Uncharacterized protein n=1 Tax=Pleurodeles waltl TaxID=8319 RepID=A0AAV7WKM4_PLEWA|nr:hypothetical protein NDU88_002226 [Pleurodeles waltl]
MPGRPFQRRRTEELTGERTTGTGGEYDEATAGGFRRYREEEEMDSGVANGSLSSNISQVGRPILKFQQTSTAACLSQVKAHGRYDESPPTGEEDTLADV